MRCLYCHEETEQCDKSECVEARKAAERRMGKRNPSNGGGTMRTIYPMARERGGNLITYACPGGYPILYMDRNGDVVCPDCANLFESDPDWRHEWDDNRPWSQFVHYEGPPEYCSHCNAAVESAYGDPDNPEAEQCGSRLK